MTDQVGQPSVEDRMMAFVEQDDEPLPNLDEEEEQPVEQNLEEESPEDENDAEVEESDEEDSQEEPEPPRKLKLKHNGEEVEMDETEVINLAQQGYDYTKKTQQLAEERKQIETYVQTIKAQEQTFQQQVQLQTALIQDIAKVAAIDDQITAYNEVDWQALSDSDPVQAQKLFFTFNQLQSKKQQMVQELNKRQQEVQMVANERLRQQTQVGLEQLQREIPDWGTEKVREVRDSAKNYGFTDQELSGITDPRYVKVLLDAAQWRKLQTAKPTVTKKVSNASAPVKPGAKDSRTAAQSAVKQTRDALRKTGNSDFAAKLIERTL